jgi:hypothetical protein
MAVLAVNRDGSRQAAKFIMKKKQIFVFGSSFGGRHVKGTALTALKKHNAVWGMDTGPQGDSYAIPTQDENGHPLPLNRIRGNIEYFVKYAQLNPDDKFIVSRIGCDNGQYIDADIAPMFRAAPKNCTLPAGWRILT